MAMISRALFTSVIGLCLMASSVTSTASSPAVKPTVCRAVWLANDPKTQSGSNSHHRRTEHADAPKKSKLRFVTPTHTVIVAGGPQSACGPGYNNTDVVACVWNGGVGQDPAAKEPGWLTGGDPRNCNRHILVELLNPKTPPKAGDTPLKVKIADGCPMNIKAKQFKQGCQELWLTSGALNKLKAPKEDVEKGKVQLRWDFVDSEPPV